MRYLLLIMLWLLALPQWAGASEDLLEDLLKRTVMTNAHRDELYRRGFDDPNTFVRHLFEIWSRAASQQNDLMKARAGGLIVYFAQDFFEMDQHYDIQNILNETEALVKRNELPVPLEPIQFLRLKYDVEMDSNKLMKLKQTFPRAKQEFFPQCSGAMTFHNFCGTPLVSC
ncbi:MAG: hypothetical protein M3Q07_04430 [Pseudobdellovibrionaceae bacterium]|nr:hypothetical protein [Pseudobdellovibrionaceae bacterium]